MKNKLLKTLGGAAVLATAITPVAALASCNKDQTPKVEFIITIDGATYDKEKSKLELNKESTIVLVDKTGYIVADIDSITIGETELTEDDYSFDAETKTITIKADAMKATTIKISVINELADAIAWKDGWYTINVNSSQGVIRSDLVDITFDLKNSLEAEQKLYYYVDIKDTTTENRTLGLTYGQAKVENKVATIEKQFIKSTLESIMYVGNHVDYDITFICVDKNDAPVWGKTIENCYLYLFAEYKFQAFSDPDNTGKSGKVDFWSNVNLLTQDWGKTINGTAEITNIRKSSGVPSDVTVVLDGEMAPITQQHIRQGVKFNKTDGMAYGESITFDITFYIYVPQYPDQKVPFTKLGLKLGYRKV